MMATQKETKADVESTIKSIADSIAEQSSELKIPPYEAYYRVRGKIIQAGLVDKSIVVEESSESLKEAREALVKALDRNHLVLRPDDRGAPTVEELSKPNADDYKLAEKAFVNQAGGVQSVMETLEQRLDGFTKSYAETSEEFNNQMEAVKKEREELMKQLGGGF